MKEDNPSDPKHDFVFAAPDTCKCGDRENAPSHFPRRTEYTEPSPLDWSTRQEAYAVARIFAMQHFDQVEPQLKKLQKTVLDLRFVIRGLSHLLGEDAPYPYSFEKVQDDARHMREVQERMKNKTISVTGRTPKQPMPMPVPRSQPPLPKPNQPKEEPK